MVAVASILVAREQYWGKHKDLASTIVAGVLVFGIVAGLLTFAVGVVVLVLASPRGAVLRHSRSTAMACGFHWKACTHPMPNP